MRPEPTAAAVGRRLVELAGMYRDVTLPDLSRMIGRQEGYLTRFVGKGIPARLRPKEIEILSIFFGVEPWELGGFIAPRSRQSRRQRPRN